MKSKEHPRQTVDDGFSTYFYSDYDDDGDDEEEEENEESAYGDSESSSVESSPGASSSEKPKKNDDEGESRVRGHVLVVAGCKVCFMYFMVPKQVEDCPKCCGQLLHFDRSDD